MPPRFRFHAKKIFATYADTGDYTPAMILEEFKAFGDIRTYAIGREKYPSREGYHIHVAVEFSEKLDTRNPRYFDIGAMHPNIQKIKKWANALNYCCKDGDYIENFLLGSPDNLEKRWKNWCLWHELRSDAQLQPVQWPFELPNARENGVVPKPHLQNKKVNWLIIGPSDWGKSWWFETTFENQKVFKVSSSGKYPFEGYDGEEVIMWDDHFPKRYDLIAATGVYKTKTPVGDSRYRKYYWAKNQRNVCIILHNDFPLYANDD